MPIPPPTEHRPFEGMALYIERVCDSYPNLEFYTVIEWFTFYHNHRELAFLMGLHGVNKERLYEAKSFVWDLITDIGKEKFGEPHEPITSERLQTAREHAAKLRLIVQDFGIKY